MYVHTSTSTEEQRPNNSEAGAKSGLGIGARLPQDPLIGEREQRPRAKMGEELVIDPVVFWERISKLYKSWNVRARRQCLHTYVDTRRRA